MCECLIPRCSSSSALDSGFPPQLDFTSFLRPTLYTTDYELSLTLTLSAYSVYAHAPVRIQIIIHVSDTLLQYPTLLSITHTPIPRGNLRLHRKPWTWSAADSPPPTITAGQTGYFLVTYKTTLSCFPAFPRGINRMTRRVVPGKGVFLRR